MALTPQQQAAMTRLEGLEKGFIISADEQEALGRLRALAGEGGSTVVATVPALYAAPPVRAAATRPSNGAAPDDFVDLDTDVYARGGDSWSPPKEDGVFDAVCTGFMVPSQAQDQIWFIVESPAGAKDYFRGNLVCAALSTPGEKGGAWKVGQVVKALGIADKVEVVEGRGIRGLTAAIGSGIKCKALWETVSITKRGTGNQNRERRVQDILPASAQPVA